MKVNPLPKAALKFSLNSGAKVHSDLASPACVQVIPAGVVI
jgi:hypothetical protein